MLLSKIRGTKSAPECDAEGDLQRMVESLRRARLQQADNAMVVDVDANALEGSLLTEGLDEHQGSSCDNVNVEAEDALHVEDSSGNVDESCAVTQEEEHAGIDVPEGTNNDGEQIEEEDDVWDYWRTPRGVRLEQRSEPIEQNTPRWRHEGHAGTLKVTIVSAHNLRKGDASGYADPYVNLIAAGQRISTPTIYASTNPEWNCTLCLAVDEAHVNGTIELQLWDDDRNALPEDQHGSDDLLGRLVFRMSDVISNGPIEFAEEPLLNVKQGTLTAQLAFLPVDRSQPIRAEGDEC